MISLENTKTKYYLGILTNLLATCIIVGIGYITKGYDIGSPDITFFKGLPQLIIFLCLLKCSPYCIKPSNQCEKDENQENDTKIIPSKRWELFAVMLYGLSVGIKTATFFGAVILIPISQLTVILSSTTPVSYIMSVFVLKVPVSLIKIVFCITVVTGVTLVVQPEFIFKTNDVSTIDCNDTHANATDDSFMMFNSSLNGINERERKKVIQNCEKAPSFIGLGVAFLFVLSAGTQINVVKKWNHVPNYLYMVWGGLGHIAVVLFFPAIGLRLRIFQDYDELDSLTWFLTILVGLLSMTCDLLLAISAKWTSPVIVGVMRRSDVLIVLIIDIAYFSRYPNTLASVGYALVLLSILGLSLCDEIKNYLKKDKTTNL